MIFEKKTRDVISFADPYRVRTQCKKQRMTMTAECQEECMTRMNEQLMREINE